MGTGSIAYGFSELAEGVHNYELGSRGDLETVSYNILRDEVFFGDQACYDTFGRTAVFVSGVIPTVSSLYEWGCSRSVSGEVSGGDTVPEGGTDVRNRHGQSVPATEKTLDMALDPETYANPNVIENGPDALRSEAELANTIAHELNHARDFIRGGIAPEASAYRAGNALSDYINGGR